MDLAGKKVLVTGSSSMIGTAVCQALQKRKGTIIIPVLHKDFDLLKLSETQKLFDLTKPDCVIHCAGWNGGIKYNKDFPADIFYKTTEMGLNVLTCSADFLVKKVLSIISSCALPDRGNEVLLASDLWGGPPNTSVECHGLSKRMLDAYSRQINKQFGIEAITAILTNSYGPGDSFHPDKTKVVGAMIRRIVEAKLNNAPEIVCWGTGQPKRELMYSIDAGEALVQTLEQYDNVNIPLCIGSDSEISIKTLAETIATIVDYKGDILWDNTKPDGQMRKKLDTKAMKSTLNIKITEPYVALKETINWYMKNKEEADAKC